MHLYPPIQAECSAGVYGGRARLNASLSWESRQMPLVAKPWINAPLGSRPAPPVESVIQPGLDDIKPLGGSGLYRNNKTGRDVVRLTKKMR
jgi:hypothetical protein